MPWFSYHGGHSGTYCRHAKDDLTAVLERAVEVGFTHYGLSEHCPRDRPEDLFADESDLGPDDLARAFEAYTQAAFGARERFADRIEVLVGFETERLPPDRWAQRMRELRASAPFDYVIGSVHDVHGHCIDYAADKTRAIADQLGGPEALQRAYFEALRELVETLRPEVVGHVDLIRKFDGSNAHIFPGAWAALERVLDAAHEVGARLDVNPGAHRRGLSPVYPLPDVLERARAMDVRVTFGDDSHGVQSVGVGLDACLQVIADAGYGEVDYLARDREGRVAWHAAPLAEVVPAIR